MHSAQYIADIDSKKGVRCASCSLWGREKVTTTWLGQTMEADFIWRGCSVEPERPQFAHADYHCTKHRRD